MAVTAGRLAGSLSRTFRVGGGTSLPGAIALKVDPRIIAALAESFDRRPAVVTATNGKTTTTNMLASIYRAAGFTPVYNAAGANLALGLATAMISAAIAKPKVEPDRRSILGFFEVDEATLKNVVGDLDPLVLTVGNIFRDQLDRFGEVDQTASLIGEGIARLSADATLVLNADDPRVASLANEAGPGAVYFGLGEAVASRSGTGSEEPPGVGATTDAQDSKNCLICGTPLTYKMRYYSHLGLYKCAGCGFERPAPTVVASEADLTLRGSTFHLTTPAGETTVNLSVPAIYNIYNALAAVATAQTVGIEFAHIVAGLESFRPAFGRFETLDVGGKRIHIMLIKNPTGFNQALEALNIDPEQKNVLMAINDNLADGTDISWLWDVDVEKLGRTNLLMTSGTRAHDMALRLKYAGRDHSLIEAEPDLGRALDKALAAMAVGSDLYILPTYTAMLDIRKYLEKLGGVAAFWQTSTDQDDRPRPAMTR